MKKLLLIIAAIFTLNSVSADLILHESFAQDAGRLTVGRLTLCNDSTKWWSQTGWTGSAQAPTDPIMIVDNSLSYTKYSSGVGNKAQLLSVAGTTDVRRFKELTTGTVYAAAIINVENVPTTDGEYFWGISNGANAMSRVYAKTVGTGFQLSIAKSSELKTDLTYTSTLNYNANYLIVLEYIFKDGTKNDSLNLYINPTKDNQVPTLICNMTLANTKADLEKIAGIYMRQKTTAPKACIDEIKVATTWEDLFTEGGDTPIEEPASITATPKSLTFGEYGTVYIGETYTKTFTVKGNNLKGDITLSTNNAQLTLDKTTITKADAESENGVEVTATLAPTALDYPEEKVTISLTTEGTTAAVAATWWAYQATICNTIAELKTEAAKGEGWSLTLKFKGEALVTYVSRPASGSTVYIQDNTAAVSITDSYWPTTIKIGDKLTDFTVTEGSPAVGVQPLVTSAPSVTVVSSGNEVVPQVVTLAELKAHAADYLMELVKVENVTLDQTSTKFGQTNDDNTPIADTFTQDGNTATINLVEGNELIGATKPQKADVIGISSSATGNVIRVRGVADVISKDNPTAIDNVAMDELLSGEYEVYTVSGQRIDALQPGVNIIRKGNTTYKVVR